MSGLLNNASNLTRNLTKFDPLGRAGLNIIMGKPAAGRNNYGEPAVIPPLPPAPTLGNAQRGANQQEDFLRRRRGVLANLYGGGSGNASSAPGSSGGATLLGQ